MHVRRIQDLSKMRQQEINRFSSNSLHGKALRSVERTIAFFDDEIAKLERAVERIYAKHANLQHRRELLLSIPGVGPKTANVILAEVPSMELFASAKQLVAFAGLAPREVTSGSSIRGKTTISKTGRSQLRTALYLPAVSARMHNPTISAFCERLEKNGKAPMKIVVASMRKLLHTIFGVLKSGKPYCSVV